MALLVEICELANETRCFKHWSTKGPSEKGILLEEYVDSLHFFLSIANYRQYDVDRLYNVYSADFALTEEAPQSLVASFKDVMSKILEMENNQNPFYYIQAFRTYLHLGKLMGFSWEEIEQGYIRKNEINHQRQDNGY